MKTSENLGKIIPALLKAQSEITFAAKDANNPFFKSKYADLPTVIDAVKPALNGNGIVFVQTIDPSDTGTLALSTRLIHVSGEWIEGTVTMPLVKTDPQAYGSAATYARRYALAAIVGLYQDDDDANDASNAKPKTQKVAAETFDKLPDEEKMLAQKIATSIKVAFSSGDTDSMKLTVGAIEDADLKVAVWGLLPSDIRSAIKKMKE